LGVISYYSLASGFLTGKYRSEKDLSQSPRGQRAGKCLNERGRRILEALDRVAGQRGSSPATVSLSWLIARPGLTAPIASATNLEQLHQLMAAPNLELSPSELELLSRESAYSS
jgi:aryl-alcohol dehydrogenase-like predicted oxidoreductase